MSQSEQGVACQLCQQSPLRPFRVPGGAQLDWCPQCGLYQNGRWVPAEGYDGTYHDDYERDSVRKLRTAIVRINQVASLVEEPGARFLDIGCSLGHTVEAAQQRGWQATGADVSVRAVDQARNRGLDCRLIEDDGLPFEDETFDVVTAWHVIEHVRNVSETLREWRRVLRPGGLLVIETPDASSRKVRLLGTRYKRFWSPQHTYTFDPVVLGEFFRMADFRIVQPPLWGNLGELSPAMATFAVAHRAQLALKRMLHVHKAFQLYARRREPIRRAA